ncbi:hypothetical protein AAC03nite_14950 [Alicyclobacillus acidoterrestris]|nr:hypothetical protein AAC03nite_14950 [Alicyclobacillus acidoterrestris]
MVLQVPIPDVDMERGYISVQRTLDYVKKQPVVKELKTDRSRRIHRTAIAGCRSSTRSTNNASSGQTLDRFRLQGKRLGIHQ